MVVYRKDAGSLAKVYYRPMLGFRGLKKDGGVPKKISPGNHRHMGLFDVSYVLINGGSFYNIMYSELFNMIGLGRRSLCPYKDFDLQVFNGTTTHTWGYMEMMVFVGDGKDLRVVNS